MISGSKSNSSNTLPRATNKFWIFVNVFPNVFTGLYNNNRDVTNDAKPPAVICPELIKYVPTPSTVAIPKEAIKYIKGDIHPALLYKDMFTLKESQVCLIKYSFCPFWSVLSYLLKPINDNIALSVELPPITIFLFDASLIRFLIKATGTNATQRTTTPIIASFQELYNITAIRPKAPNTLVVIVLIWSIIPVDAVCGSFIYLEIIIPDEFSSKNCGCICINLSNKSNLTSLVILWLVQVERYPLRYLKMPWKAANNTTPIGIIRAICTLFITTLWFNMVNSNVFPPTT